jgi:N-acetylglucosamine kinase-like BadF-type ATPase
LSAGERPTSHVTHVVGPPGRAGDTPAGRPLWLGIDGGGTKTTAVIVGEDCAELGSGGGGPCNIASCEASVLETSVRTAVDEAKRAAGSGDGCTFRHICAGVAGYTAEDRREPFVQMLAAILGADPADITLEPDYRIAYWGAAEGEDGIVAIAGTGAIVYGCTSAGLSHREDGRGFLLGDRGSGFDLGRRALRHTLARLEKGHADRLTDAIVAQTGANTPNRIIQWLYGGFRPARVAALAPAVGKLADDGDEAAVDLVVEMAHLLRHSVRVTAEHLAMMPARVPVYPLGGLWRIGRLLLSEFAAPAARPGHEDERLLDPYTISEPRRTPASGAAALARFGAARGDSRPGAEGQAEGPA